MSLSNLNSLCQENIISIKKIFLMLIRGVSVPNTHYPVKYGIVCWLLLWSQYPSSWSAAKDHSLSAHISWDREKWMQLNSHLTFPISLTLMSSGKLFLPSGMSHTTYSCTCSTDRWHLPCWVKPQTKCPSLKLGASHVMMTFLRKDSLWHRYITKYNAELLIQLCPHQDVITSAWHC